MPYLPLHYSIITVTFIIIIRGKLLFISLRQKKLKQKTITKLAGLNVLGPNKKYEKNIQKEKFKGWKDDLAINSTGLLSWNPCSSPLYSFPLPEKTLG